jgi:O-antigen/teichoic acid export membrane protein
MFKPSFRSLFKDIATYGFGDLLLRATSLITLPIYTRVFSPADYGVLSYVLTVINLLSAVLSLGCASAYSLYFFEAKSIKEKQVVTSTCLAFVVIWTGGIILLCLPFSKSMSSWSFNTEQYWLLFFLAFLTIPMNLLNTMLGQVLRNQFKARIFTVLNVAAALLTVGFGVVCVLILKWGLKGIIAGGLLASAAVFPVRVWSVRQMIRPYYSGEMLRKLLAYGVPLVPMTLAYWVFEVSDRLLLGKLSTLDQLGLYAVANSVTTVLAFLYSALGQAWSPHALNVREEQPELAPAFFGQVLTYVLISFGVICVGLAAFAHEALTILTSPKFYPAAMAIGPLALGFVAYASTQVTATGLALSKKTGYFALFSWLAALLNIGLNVLTIPRWGMMAASWSTAVSYIFLTLAYTFSAQRYWRVQYEKYRAATVALLTVVFTVGVMLLPSTNFITGLAVKTVYCLIYVVLLFVFQVVDQRELGGMLALWRGVRVRLMRQEL